MHKLLTPHYKKTDHKDRNGCNNQKLNLREANNSQNGANKIKFSHRKMSSKYKGVHLLPNGKYRASIMVHGYKCGLGNYTDEKEAAKAYNDNALLNFGEFAVLNIIE